MKQNAEISATQDYYEFVCFDRMRWFAIKYDGLARQKHGTLRVTPEPSRQCGCNKRTMRVETAYCRHDRDRGSVTVPNVTRNTMLGLVTEGVTAVG
jgi:hypothetical protein